MLQGNITYTLPPSLDRQCVYFGWKRWAGELKTTLGAVACQRLPNTPVLSDQALQLFLQSVHLANLQQKRCGVHE